MVSRKSQRGCGGETEIEVASLGVDDAYFIMQTDGKSWYNLMGQYDALDEVMTDLRNGDIEVRSFQSFFSYTNLLPLTSTH